MDDKFDLGVLADVAFAADLLAFKNRSSTIGPAGANALKSFMAPDAPRTGKWAVGRIAEAQLFCNPIGANLSKYRLAAARPLR